METYVINPRAFGEVTEDQFFQFCLDNSTLRIERNSEGQIIIVPPTGSETGIPNSDIITELVIWNRRAKLGLCFGSSVGFTLPNRAVRSPNAAWITKERWAGIPEADQEKFAHL